MKIAYAIVVGLLATAGHAAAQPTDAPADTVIALERGACERRCAVYSVTIRGDGSVTYEGRHYVRTTGTKRSRISPAAVAELAAAFEAEGYYRLADQYGMAGSTEGCTELRSDAPIAKTSIVSGGRTKTVAHHHRCVGTFSEPLKRLETAIDRAANTAQWIK
jgi:hypothetical protein